MPQQRWCSEHNQNEAYCTVHEKWEAQCDGCGKGWGQAILGGIISGLVGGLLGGLFCQDCYNEKKR